jgi:putative endonuclease
VTSHLTNRITTHKDKSVTGFSQKYNLDKLVYFELLDGMYDAISREKQLKNWRRQWKIELIESFNPNWRDLSDIILVI